MMQTLSLIALSIGAAAAAYLGNRVLLARLGAISAVTFVPWWEEGCKLAAASLLLPAVPMLFVHLCFGALELAYDLWQGQDDALFLGLLSFACHGLCGGVAMLVYDANAQGALFWALLGAGLTHTLYMAAVMHLVLPTLGIGPGARVQRR